MLAQTAPKADDPARHDPGSRGGIGERRGGHAQRDPGRGPAGHPEDRSRTSSARSGAAHRRGGAAPAEGPHRPATASTKSQRKRGMLPSTAEVQSALDELHRNNNAPDDAQFRALLKAEGLTMEQVRRTIGERMAIGRLLARQIRSAIILSEDDIAKYYQTHQDKLSDGCRKPRSITSCLPSVPTRTKAQSGGGSTRRSGRSGRRGLSSRRPRQYADNPLGRGRSPDRAPGRVGARDRGSRVRSAARGRRRRFGLRRVFI